MDQLIKDKDVASSAQELEQAFKLFIRMSDQLSETYSSLENRIMQLEGELATVTDKRMQELIEKERLAYRLEGLMRVLPVGMVELDNLGKIIACNPIAIHLLGKPLLGQDWCDIIARAFQPKNDDGHEVSLHDGKRLRILTSALESEPGQILLLLDLTETRVLQQQLSQHEKLSAMGEMAASLAHQIRTPLSTAILYAGHLKQAELDNTTRCEFAQKLLARLQHIEYQVRDMLLFARSGKVVFKKTEISDLMLHVKQAIEAQVQQESVELIINYEEGLVEINEDALIGALQNLVDNALQAAGNGVVIAINATVTDNKQLQLQVSDNGPGMSVQLKQKIFDAFFTTRTQGTGLGLAVVKSVAEMHDGTVRLESELGVGTNVSMILPVLMQFYSKL